MAKGKQVTPPKRDYKAERERTKQNKASAQQEAPPEKKAGPAKAKKPKVNEELKKTAATHDISLYQISSDPNQPRKFFDAGELLELSKSILQHGVIEPILLRPDADGFIIVFGERRFRACMLAAEVNTNLQTIPAMIKDMTADEAFALQIAENLHRKDPHPIEEAYAFKKMLERGQTAEDIAATVCKSTKFVAMRLMLNDLITEWQDVFFANKIKIGEAVKLAKLGMDSQKEIYNEEVPDNWKEDEDFQLNDLDYYIGKNENNLDSAPFGSADVTLYPEAGACVGCKFNSLSNLVLFQNDKTTKGICSNAACYGIKRSRAYNIIIEEVMTDPEVIFIAGSSYLSDTDKKKIDELKKMGVTVSNVNGVKFNQQQLIAPNWNEFIENNPMDITDEDQESYEARLHTDFNEELAAYKNFMQEYEAAKSKGGVKKAFIISGPSEGKFINILLSEDQQGTLNMPDGSPMTSDVAQQVKTIETRLARACELDSEKIWSEVRELITKDDFTALIHEDDLNSDEIAALRFAMWESLGYEERGIFLKMVGMKDADFFAISNVLSDSYPSNSLGHFSLLVRMFLKAKLFPAVGSHKSSIANRGGYMVATSYFGEGIAVIEQAHKDKAEKRAKNAKKKIDDLLNPKQGKQDKEEQQGDEE